MLKRGENMERTDPVAIGSADPPSFRAPRRRNPRTAISIASLFLVLTVSTSASAGTITNSFLTSTSGTAHLLGLPGDTIQFEVLITTTAGRNYSTILWSLTGDRAGALAGTPATWATTADHLVTNWEWHYTPPGGGKVKMGVNGRAVPFPPTQGVGNSVSSPYGFFGTSKTGDGVQALVGTVTIAVGAEGLYQGGAYFYPGVDTFIGSAGEEGATVSGGTFTVVNEVIPEPGVPLLMMLGLVGLGIVGRSSKP